MPERLLVVLDMERRELWATLSGHPTWGRPSAGLKGRTLYPAISAVWGQCQVRINYLGERRGEAWDGCAGECSAPGGCGLGWMLSALQPQRGMGHHLTGFLPSSVPGLARDFTAVT